MTKKRRIMTLGPVAVVALLLWSGRVLGTVVCPQDGTIVVVHCPTYHKCSCQISVPGIGTTNLTLRGLGDATIQCSAGDPPIATGLHWQRLNVEELNRSLGKVALNLDPSVASDATIDSANVDVNRFFFQIHVEVLGATPLVSDVPVVMVGTIHSLPPTATFTKAGSPVNFYRLGDPTKATVASVISAVAEVTPNTSDVVPTLSLRGMILLVSMLLLLGASIIFWRRRRGLAAG